MSESSEAEDRHVDGNGIAGLLGQVLVGDVTLVRRHCPSCGDRSPAAAHLAYRGAGAVLRCPRCHAVALRIVDRGDAYVFELAGVWTLAKNSG